MENKTTEEVNNEIKIVSDFLRANADVEIPATFNGCRVSVAGIDMMSYLASGLQPVCSGHLKSDDINYNMLEDAQRYRNDVRKAAEALGLKVLRQKHARIWTHDGSRFVEI